jgi:hypothetical protein
MSTISTDFRAPAVARSTALRAADGVIAGYIHSLAQTAAQPAARGAARPRLGRLAAHAYGCSASRGSGLATRRRPALRRVPSPA